MRLINRLWTWLTKVNMSSSTKGHPTLYPIDAAELVKELRIKEEAEALAKAGKPSPDQKQLSATENHAIQRINQIRTDYIDWGTMRQAVLNNTLTQHDVTKSLNRALGAVDEFNSQASRLLTEHDALMSNLASTAQNKQNELLKFREQHNLSRMAHYPSSTGKIFGYVLAFFLIIIEALLNSYLFSEGLDSGLIGGFIYALLSAGINIFVAFILGMYLIRFIFQKKFMYKFIGILSVFFALFMILTISLSIAHLRDALSLSQAEPAKLVLNTLITTPFNLNDIFSWLLLAISIVFALGALFDGLKMDDNYPGYGSSSRNANEAKEEYEEELSNLRALLEEIKDEILEEVDNVITQSQTNISIFERTIDDKKSSKIKLDQALNNAHDTLQVLISTFRDVNRQHRGQLAVPTYFKKTPELDRLDIKLFTANEDNNLLLKQKEQLQNLLEKLQEIRLEIQNSFNEKFDRYKPLNGNFIDGVSN